MKRIFTILACLLAGAAFSQPTSLSGIITQRETGKPIANLRVYTYFDETRTNSYGQYRLNLSACPRCTPGAPIVIYTDSDSLGASETQCTISNDFTCSFSISRNPTQAFIIGKIISRHTEDPIEGIYIKAVSEIDGIQTSEVRTDQYGQFRIAIDKTQIKDNKYVRLLARDQSGRYQMTPSYGEPQAYNINSFAVLRMQRKPDTFRLAVAALTRVSAPIPPRSTVTIKAHGNIRVGSFVGSSDPDGKSSGVFGFGLARYNIVSSFNHAALMYRFKGEDNWKLSGKNVQFNAGRGGYLELEVNDNTQSDNRGAYTVEVIVEQ
jgi:hypothetical protein